MLGSKTTTTKDSSIFLVIYSKYNALRSILAFEPNRFNLVDFEILLTI